MHLHPTSTRKEDSSGAVHLDISREDDFLRRAQNREQDPEQQNTNAEEKNESSSKTLLNFPVMIHHDTKDVDLPLFTLWLEKSAVGYLWILEQQQD